MNQAVKDIRGPLNDQIKLDNLGHFIKGHIHTVLKRRRLTFNIDGRVDLRVETLKINKLLSLNGNPDLLLNILNVKDSINRKRHKVAEDNVDRNLTKLLAGRLMDITNLSNDVLDMTNRTDRLSKNSEANKRDSHDNLNDLIGRRETFDLLSITNLNRSFQDNKVSARILIFNENFNNRVRLAMDIINGLTMLQRISSRNLIENTKITISSNLHLTVNKNNDRIIIFVIINSSLITHISRINSNLSTIMLNINGGHTQFGSVNNATIIIRTALKMRLTILANRNTIRISRRNTPINIFANQIRIQTRLRIMRILSRLPRNRILKLRTNSIKTSLTRRTRHIIRAMQIMKTKLPKTIRLTRQRLLTIYLDSVTQLRLITIKMNIGIMLTSGILSHLQMLIMQLSRINKIHNVNNYSSNIVVILRHLDRYNGHLLLLNIVSVRALLQLLRHIKM